jgi:hypothetical protein
MGGSQGGGVGDDTVVNYMIAIGVRLESLAFIPGSVVQT